MTPTTAPGARPIVHLPQRHSCGCVSVSLICPHTATMPAATPGAAAEFIATHPATTPQAGTR